jgi:hypothetical protein
MLLTFQRNGHNITAGKSRTALMDAVLTSYAWEKRSTTSQADHNGIQALVLPGDGKTTLMLITYTSVGSSINSIHKPQVAFLVPSIFNRQFAEHHQFQDWRATLLIQSAHISARSLHLANIIIGEKERNQEDPST